MGSSLSTASSADVRDELTRNPNWVYMQDIFKFVGNVDGRMVIKILELDKSRWLGAFNLCDDGDDKLGYLQVGMMRQEQIVRMLEKLKAQCSPAPLAVAVPIDDAVTTTVVVPTPHMAQAMAVSPLPAPPSPPAPASPQPPQAKRSASSMSVTDGEESVGEEQPPSKKPTPTTRATRSKGGLVVDDYLRNGKDKGKVVAIHNTGEGGRVEVQWEGEKGTTHHDQKEVSKWVVKPPPWVCSECKKPPGDNANMRTPKADAVKQKPPTIVMCSDCFTAATKNKSNAEKMAYDVIIKVRSRNPEPHPPTANLPLDLARRWSSSICTCNSNNLGAYRHYQQMHTN